MANLNPVQPDVKEPFIARCFLQYVQNSEDELVSPRRFSFERTIQNIHLILLILLALDCCVSSISELLPPS